MNYLPSFDLFRKMVESFIVGEDSEPVKSLDEIMAFYIEKTNWIIEI